MTGDPRPGRIADVTDDQVYRVNVLLEEIRTVVGVISDGHKALDQKIDRNHAELTGRVDRLDLRLGRIEGDMATVKLRLGTVEGGLGRIERHVGPNGAGPPRPAQAPEEVTSPARRLLRTPEALGAEGRLLGLVDGRVELTSDGRPEHDQSTRRQAVSGRCSSIVLRPE